MKTNDEIKKMAREVVNQMHDAEITKPPHVVITYTELNDLVGQICQVKDADRERAVEEERERIVKVLNKRMREYAQGRKECGSSPEEEARAGRIEQREYALSEAIKALTPNISNDK